jgi:myosin heavy subunit
MFLSCGLVLSLIVPTATQVIVQTLGSQSFGKSSASLGRNVEQPKVVPSPSRSPHVDTKVQWKKVAARLAAKVDAPANAASDWQRLKEHKAIDSQIVDLKHAQGALGYLEERAANKLHADIDEVDHLIVRKHLLTDRRAENEKDVSVIEAHASSLRRVAANLETDGSGAQSDGVRAVDDEVTELNQAAAALRGNPGELKRLNVDIDATTEDGRKMDAEVRRLSKSRAAITRQIRVLTEQGDELQDSEETARDFEAFEKRGYDDMSDKDDPYVQEATDALERASGWNKNDLDAQAVKAREAMTKGLAANPGEAVRALRAVRPYRRF